MYLFILVNVALSLLEELKNDGATNTAIPVFPPGPHAWKRRQKMKSLVVVTIHCSVQQLHEKLMGDQWVICGKIITKE